MSTERVLAALRNAGIEPRVHRDESGMHTSQQAADAVGCELGAIVKSLVFLVDDEPVIILTSGSRRVDTQALARVLGAAVRRADAELVRQLTGFPIGGVPPLAHLRPLPTYYDPAVLQYEEVWASLGHPNAVFAVEPGALLAATGARPLPDEVFVPLPA